MGGIGSGDKTESLQELQRRVIKRAWYIMEWKLNNKNYTKLDGIALNASKDITIKSMPTKIEAEVNGSLLIDDDGRVHSPDDKSRK